MNASIYDDIPVQYMREPMRLWIENGICTGDFLTALLSNNLYEAFNRADDNNKAALEQWLFWLYNYAPAGCWGSLETFNNWKNNKRQTGEISQTTID